MEQFATIIVVPILVLNFPELLRLSLKPGLQLIIVCFSIKCACAPVCFVFVCVCVWYLTEMIIDKSPKYGCHFSLAPMVIWGSLYSSPVFPYTIGYK